MDFFFFLTCKTLEAYGAGNQNVFWLLGGNLQDDEIGEKVGINVGVSCENSLERSVHMWFSVFGSDPNVETVNRKWGMQTFLHVHHFNYLSPVIL